MTVRGLAGRVVGETRLRQAAEAVRTARTAFGLSGLTHVATVYGTDKVGDHHYTPHYARHLARFRRRRFTLLEIGVFEGASLRTWRRYFPRAQIVGLDIEDKRVHAGRRISVYQGDQSDAALLERIVRETGRPDVVIDDGSHHSDHVRATFATLFPLLADDGVYVIEDTQTSYWPTFNGSLDRHDTTTTMALVKDLLDGLNHEEFLDEDYRPSDLDRTVVAVHAYHNLVVIEKGRNCEGSNKSRLRDYL
ncbi:class I SAM-dependent methyltransferase [Flexivirga sp. ID2601S]|uniref:Class I SAM-dependent methyltransferase n=1 Tax=Flexivirga aerilata TaxID=1656889 RepID=A0A849AJR6_9MICO|nr:class I SAM-dependent methyltransferase [Flexivirga aerilata]NNG40077.1 class I SAM-dependent methyltransferase [Flexivirga aerilata]